MSQEIIDELKTNIEKLQYQTKVYNLETRINELSGDLAALREKVAPKQNEQPSDVPLSMKQSDWLKLEPKDRARFLTEKKGVLVDG